MDKEQQQALTESLAPGQIAEEGYRWVNTGVYVLAALFNSAVVHTFTPINI
jgi:hypothetical protein